MLRFASMKLPPLNAVRAFEAVARHRSFRIAAEELFVTPGAVSQQVRLLEQWLGTRVFERRSTGIVLTQAGEQLQATATRSLRALAQTAERLRPGGSVVRISALPSFAARWLVPRLDQFTRLHPAVQVQIEASVALADFECDATDLAIRYMDLDPSGLEWRELAHERLYPVCSRPYARMHVRAGRIQPTARLLHETFSSVVSDYWSRWLAEQRCDDIDASRGLFFSHEMLTHDAALSGQGIALANPFLIEPELSAGRLTIAVDAPLITGKRYLVVWGPAGRTLREPARQFRDWLIDAFAATDAALSAPRPSSSRRRSQPAAAPAAARRRASARADPT